MENLELSDLEDLRQQGRDTEAFFLAEGWLHKELRGERIGDRDFG